MLNNITNLLRERKNIYNKMYWGNPDVSVKFCEDKYGVSNYVAEYYNTLSAIFYIIVVYFHV